MALGMTMVFGPYNDHYCAYRASAVVNRGGAGLWLGAVSRRSILVSVSSCASARPVAHSITLLVFWSCGKFCWFGQDKDGHRLHTYTCTRMHSLSLSLTHTHIQLHPTVVPVPTGSPDRFRFLSRYPFTHRTSHRHVQSVRWSCLQPECCSRQ